MIALSLGTTVLIKMGRAKYAWVTLVPMLFLLVVTMTAGVQKIFSQEAAGFIPAIEGFRAQLATAAPDAAKNIKTLIFNNQVDIAVTAFFMVLVLLIVAANVHLWWRLLTGKKESHLSEQPRVDLTSILAAKK